MEGGEHDGADGVSPLMQILKGDAQQLATDFAAELDEPLSDRTMQAVVDLLAKALVLGANRGITDAIAQVGEQLPEAQLEIHMPGEDA